MSGRCVGCTPITNAPFGPIRFIQLHLELEDNIPLIEAHRISDEVEAKLISVFPDADVLIHQDLYSVVFGPEKQQKFHSW